MRRRELLAALFALEAPRLPLGFSLYGMKGVPWREALSACAQLRYEAVELALLPGYAIPAAEYGEFTGRLRDLRLTLAALMENVTLIATPDQHQQNLERLRLARDAAVVLRCPTVETIMGGKPGMFVENRQMMAERLGEWAQVFAKSGVQLAVKAHVLQAVQRPEQLVWLLRQAGSGALRAAYDYSHFEAQGLAMEGTVKQLARHTVFVHMKDVAAQQPVRFLLPGEGRTDYPRLAALLLKYGYKGAAVVEVSAQIHNAPGYDPIAAARKCRERLCPAFACR